MSSDNSVSDSDRLVLDVTIRENTREETYNDFETLFREQFGAVYDEVECTVQTDSGQGVSD